MHPDNSQNYLGDADFRKKMYQRVPAMVFASLAPGTFRIIIHPGMGLLDGGAPCDIPLEIIPFELRVPNKLIWIKFDENMNIIQIWERNEEE